jgi:hypothetical protein
VTELREEILVHAAKDILRSVLLVAQAYLTDQVDQFTQALLIEGRPRVLFR